MKKCVKKVKNVKGRRNIRKIMKTHDLQFLTKQAVKLELDRKERALSRLTEVSSANFSQS